MLCQSLASLFVGFECFVRLRPDVFIDTTGAPFIYPLAKYIFGSKVIAYVHYPIISTVSDGIF